MILKSRTVWFMIVMAGMEAAHQVISANTTMLGEGWSAYITSILLIVTTMGGVYMRTITTKPLSEK